MFPVLKNLPTRIPKTGFKKLGLRKIKIYKVYLQQFKYHLPVIAKTRRRDQARREGGKKKKEERKKFSEQSRKNNLKFRFKSYI